MTSVEMAPPMPGAVESADPNRGLGFMNWLRNSRPGELLTNISVGAAIILPLGGAAGAAQAEAASTLVQDCVDQELVKPQVEKAEIRSPGTANQTTNVMMELDATPEECRDAVDRLFQYEVIVKQTIPVHGKLKRVTTRLVRFNGSYFNREESGLMGISGVPNPHNSRERIRPCSPGRAKTTARLKIRGVISNAVTQEEEARKLWWGPIDLKRKKPC